MSLFLVLGIVLSFPSRVPVSDSDVALVDSERLPHPLVVTRWHRHCEVEADGPYGPRATGQELAGADAGILEGLGEVQPLHRAIGGDAALRFKAQAAVGLFFTRNPDVADGVVHGISVG